MKVQTVNIIKALVNDLGVDFTITSVIANIDGSFTLGTRCTWWIREGETHTIQGNDYLITSFVINQQITVTQVNHAVVPTIGTFSISAPQYIHGTLKMAANEVDAKEDKTILCPFVYLYEIITDKEDNDEESMIERTIDVRIFFLNSADSVNWLTADHYTYVIDPMQQMVNLFMEKIKTSNLFTDDFKSDSTPLINVSEEGRQEKAVFDCNLSGIELRLFAEIREDLSCESNCNC